MTGLTPGEEFRLDEFAPGSHTRFGRRPTGQLEHLRSQIDADHLGPAAGQLDAVTPRAAADVQDTLAGGIPYQLQRQLEPPVQNLAEEAVDYALGPPLVGPVDIVKPLCYRVEVAADLVCHFG